MCFKSNITWWNTWAPKKYDEMTWSSKRFEKKLVNFEEKDPSFFLLLDQLSKILGLNFNGFETSSWQVFEFWPQDPRAFETYRINVKYLSLLECSFFKVDAVKWQHETVLTLCDELAILLRISFSVKTYGEELQHSFVYPINKQRLLRRFDGFLTARRNLKMI